MNCNQINMINIHFKQTTDMNTLFFLLMNKKKSVTSSSNNLIRRKSNCRTLNCDLQLISVS